MNKPESSPAPIIEALISKAKASGTLAPDHGFSLGAAGVEKFRQYAPTQVTSGDQLNLPLGQAKADEIATALRLKKSLCLTAEQYAALISGKGKDGSGSQADAKLIDESVAIFTNSKANPLIRNINGQPTKIVLGSYGLMVNTNGMLESLANSTAPTRQANSVIAPGGYLGKWARANDAEETLKMLYESAYTRQLPPGIAAQHEGTAAELALYLNGAQSAVVGVSMVPSIWEVNFCLLYALNPAVAANMPAYWAPIPPNVVAALEKSALDGNGGQVPFSDYALELNYSPV